MDTKKNNAEKKVNDLIDRSVSRLGTMVDANTVIGAPIQTPSGFQVIPVSKVTLGYLSGGGDLGDVKVVREGENIPFAGGSGAVLSLKPAGFLVDDGKSCRFVYAGEDPVDNLIDKASELIHDFNRGHDA